MTTIAYRDGVLAADTQVTCGSTRDGAVTKIAQRGPILAAAAGNAPGCLRFLDWFTQGMTADCPGLGEGDDAATGTIFWADWVVIFSTKGVSRRQCEFFADGSGWGIALGAMAAGATAEEAVRAACRFDVNSGGDVTVLRRPSV